MQLDASPVPLAGDDVPTPGTIVGLGWFCGKDLQESDRVEFDDSSLDPYGMPGMQIHYRLTDADHEAIAAAARASILRAAEALGDPLDDSDPFTFPPGASLHYQGSVRMGEHRRRHLGLRTRPRRSGSCPDLFVAGNGVIPTSIACNPTLTVRRARRRRRPPHQRTTRSTRGTEQMLDSTVIQGRGFRNVVEDGRVTGFQLELRNPNYRGRLGQPARRHRGRRRRRAGPRPRAAVDRAGPHLHPATSCGSAATCAGARRAATVTVPEARRSVGRVCTTRRRGLRPPVLLPAVMERSSVHRPRQVRAGAAGARRRPEVVRLDLQLHRRHLHADDPGRRAAPTSPTSVRRRSRSSARATSPATPTPTRPGSSSWHALVERYGLTPTNFGAWVDTTRWHDRGADRGRGHRRSCSWTSGSPTSSASPRCDRSSA